MALYSNINENAPFRMERILWRLLVVSHDHLWQIELLLHYYRRVPFMVRMQVNKLCLFFFVHSWTKWKSNKNRSFFSVFSLHSSNAMLVNQSLGNAEFCENDCVLFLFPYILKSVCACLFSRHVNRVRSPICTYESGKMNLLRTNADEFATGLAALFASHSHCCCRFFAALSVHTANGVSVCTVFPFQFAANYQLQYLI